MTKYENRGKFVRIKIGAFGEMKRRGWDRGVESSPDGKFGVLDYEFFEGVDDGDHHITVVIDGESMGIPFKFVEFSRQENKVELPQQSHKRNDSTRLLERVNVILDKDTHE